MLKLSEMVSQKDFILVQSEIEIPLEDLRRANRMLYKLWDRYFGLLEKKPFGDYEREELADTIYAVEDIIFGYIRDTENFIGSGEKSA